MKPSKRKMQEKILHILDASVDAYIRFQAEEKMLYQNKKNKFQRKQKYLKTEEFMEGVCLRKRNQMEEAMNKEEEYQEKIKIWKLQSGRPEKSVSTLEEVCKNEGSQTYQRYNRLPICMQQLLWPVLCGIESLMNLQENILIYRREKEELQMMKKLQELQEQMDQEQKELQKQKSSKSREISLTSNKEVQNRMNRCDAPLSSHLGLPWSVLEVPIVIFMTVISLLVSLFSTMIQDARDAIILIEDTSTQYGRTRKLQMEKELSSAKKKSWKSRKSNQ